VQPEDGPKFKHNKLPYPPYTGEHLILDGGMTIGLRSLIGIDKSATKAPRCHRARSDQAQ
jgi:hypothetical protein